MNDPVLEKPLHERVESALLLPDVDQVLNAGHAIYTADNPYMKGTHDQEVAKRQVKEFLELQTPPNARAVAYRWAIFGIARGYARDLGRCRDEWVQNLKDAREEKNYRDKTLRDGSFTLHSLNVLWKFVGPLFLGLAGYLFAQVVGATVPIPQGVADVTGTVLPSLLMSLAFALGGRYFMKWLTKRRSNQIVVAYELRKYLAELSYKEKKKVSLEYWREKGREEWLRYTGQPYPETLSYLVVMKTEMEVLQRFHEHDTLYRKSDIERARAVIRSFLETISPWRWSRREKSAPSAEAE